MPTKSFDSRAHTLSSTDDRLGWSRVLRASTVVALGAVMTTALPTAPVHAQEADQAPAALERQTSVDACPARGEVHGLDPMGDGFLAVRNGSSTKHEQIDELHNGDVVILCDFKNGWHGVVYPSADQDPEECRPSPSQSAKPEPYRGPCKTGWIHGNWVRRITS